MARTVKVDLLLDVAKYLRPAREAKRETQGVAESLDDAAKAGGRASAALDGTAREMSDAARAAAKLDRRVDELRESLRQLAVQSALTGDAGIEKQMRAKQGELRKAQSARKLLPDMGGAGEQAAEKFSAQFVQRLGPLLAKVPMGATGGAIGGIIAVPVTAIVGAAASAAILGGVGVGGVIGGLTLASRDARVQAAGKSLSDSVMGDLESSASRFVEPAVAGIGIIRSAWNDVAGDVDGVFAATSGYVEPLAQGLAGMVRAVGPGLRDAAEAAGPVIRELSDGLPRIGSALSDLLSTAADHAGEAASAVRLIVSGIELGIDVTAGFIDGFATLYRWLVVSGSAAADFAYSLYGWMPIIGDQIGNNRDHMHELKDALDKGGDAGDNAGMKIWGGLNKVDTAASAASAKVETLNEAIKRMAGENISAEQANIRLEEAIARATEAGAKNNAGIHASTEKGRSNRSALIGIAEAANASADAIFKQTGSQDLASAATTRGRAKFLEAAHAMHVGKDQAIALADKLFAIPKNVGSKITVTANTSPALNSAQAVVARINNMRARIGVGAYGSGAYGGSAHTGQGHSTGQRWGGAYEHARDGLVNLRQADIYSAQGPARYAFAEPATGGEAFIPKYGNRDRSLDILSTAARWYGLQVGPMSRATAPAAAAPSHSPVQLAAALRAAIAGLSVQMDGRAVGVIQGRQADMLSR